MMNTENHNLLFILIAISLYFLKSVVIPNAESITVAIDFAIASSELSLEINFAIS